MINSNIGCIETHLHHAQPLNFLEINSNIGCIETMSARTELMEQI